MLRRLIEILLEKSFQYSDHPTFRLASGKLSDIYVDSKPTTLNAEGMVLIANLIFEKIRDLNVNAIGGLVTGSQPIADAVSFLSFLEKKPINSFFVRNERKDHGTKKMVEGDVRKGDKVVIVDDVITTGASTIEAIEAAKEEGLVVVKVIVLVDREEGGREEILERVDDFDSIVTRTSLLEAFNDKHPEKRIASGQSMGSYQAM